MVATDFTQTQLQQRNFAIAQVLRWTESIMWIFVLTFYSGAVVGLTFSSAAELDSADSSFARNLWLLSYGLVLFLAVFRLPKIIRLASFNPLIILCVLWCGLSVMWSIDPGISLRRAVALLMTTFAGLAFAARYDWNEMVQHIACVALILCFITIVLVILNPTRGIMQEIHPGAWRGPFVEKNQLGGIMTKCFAVVMCAFAMRPQRGWFWVPIGVLCFTLVLLSTSKTSLLVSLACLGLFISLRVFRRFPFLRIIVVFGFVSAVTLIVSVLLIDPAWALGLIGKDPSLTGRTDIWVLLIEAVNEKFWLGYGYGVYWIDPLGPSYQIREILQWPVPTAHNGWFDAWLSAGFVIICMFGLLLFMTVLMALSRIKHGGVETYWVILSLFFFMAFSLSESTILQQNDLSWFLFVATASKLWAREKPYWRPGSVPFVARMRIWRG